MRVCRYEQEGMRRSVDAVLLVHKNNTLHILILQVGNLFFKLPGGRLKPGEDGSTLLLLLCVTMPLQSSPSA